MYVVRANGDIMFEDIRIYGAPAFIPVSLFLPNKRESLKNAGFSLAFVLLQAVEVKLKTEPLLPV